VRYQRGVHIIISSWTSAALSARGEVDAEPGISLAVPTWLYGSEPTTTFATVYAKYFQNSIREETLVTQGRSGVLYAQGGGGTSPEIFQDVEIHYYVNKAEAFTPMIFVDPDGYWQKMQPTTRRENWSRPALSGRWIPRFEMNVRRRLNSPPMFTPSAPCRKGTRRWRSNVWS